MPPRSLRPSQWGSRAPSRHKDAPGHAWGTGAAFADGAHRFVDTVNAGIVGLLASLPVLVVLAIAGLLAGRLWRTRGTRVDG